MTMPMIEAASRQAWPALQEQELAFGILRYAQGISRRTNSLNLFLEASVTPLQVLDVTESFFQSHKLPAIVRIVHNPSSALNNAALLDDFLQQHNYVVVTPTSVMVCDLYQNPQGLRLVTAQPCQAVELMAWLQVWHALLCKNSNELEVQCAMLQRIQHPHLFLVQYDSDGKPCSCGMAVLKGDLLGVFGIATAVTQRGKGLATRLIQGLQQWGKSRGARHAYLQVEEANKPALAVYDRLGFENAYSYWYREKHFNSNR